MKLLRLEKGRKKKWVAVFRKEDNTSSAVYKRVEFGQVGAEDYTTGASEVKKKSYLARHKVDLKTGDVTRAGYLSYYILWGDSRDIEKNFFDYKEKFGL